MILEHDHYVACNRYLDRRKGTYEFRCRRYGAVADKLVNLGLKENDIIVDVGAGRCEMGKYLRDRFPSLGLIYIPFDGSIDGVDLAKWHPPIKADFYIAIEFIEHLHSPEALLRDMLKMSRKGVVVTTPNADCVDVLGMDETHKTPIGTGRLLAFGMNIEPVIMFTEDRFDTLIGWMESRATPWGHVKT